ncbi:PQQ-binding-like beta-propeller repeat protein [Streptomyces sp. ICC1]|uniref:PQQ-binding-like beta-propeller repeat protein n=1 Tax=Streptomyces sp. ICC1 TaxID=2099583 RepID=UPI000DDB5C93|nr:PQQ-binding-like beta-propeller repeat protein [Streptomyces sp. ICC1]
MGRGVRGQRARQGLLLAGGALGTYLLTGSAGGSPGPATARGTAPPVPPAAPAVAPWQTSLGDRAAACSWQAAALYCSGAGLAAARIDPADGTVLWSVRSAQGAARTDAPLYGGGLVLTAPAGGRVLQALDPATGAERWRHALPSGAKAVPAGDRVVVTGADGKATALDAATGAVRWTKDIGGVGSVWCAGPAEADGAAVALYVSTPAGDGKSTQVAEVDPANGAPRGQVRVAGTVEPFAVAGGSLHLLDSDAELMTHAVVRIDLRSRAVRTTRLLAPLLQAQAAAGPDGEVYVFGTSGALAAVGPEREEWRLETGVSAASRPVSGDGLVYLSALDGRLLAVDTASRRLAGQTKPRMGSGKQAANLPAPAAGGGRVYASAPDGSVFAVPAGAPAGW